MRCTTPPHPPPEHAKYDAWVAQLEARRESLGRSARRVDWLFIVAVASGLAALAVSKWVALVVVAFGLIIAVTGRYLIMMYRWGYALQIERTRLDAGVRQGKRSRASSTPSTRGTMTSARASPPDASLARRSCGCPGRGSG